MFQKEKEKPCSRELFSIKNEIDFVSTFATGVVIVVKNTNLNITAKLQKERILQFNTSEGMPLKIFARHLRTINNRILCFLITNNNIKSNPIIREIPQYSLPVQA